MARYISFIIGVIFILLMIFSIKLAPGTLYDDYSDECTSDERNIPICSDNLNISSDNIIIGGENNQYSNNEIVSGNNNVKIGNTYIAGNNNDVSDNTHEQGDNNTYTNNTIVGSSNNDIHDKYSVGKSNRNISGKSRTYNDSNDSNDFINSILSAITSIIKIIVLSVRLVIGCVVVIIIAYWLIDDTADTNKTVNKSSSNNSVVVTPPIVSDTALPKIQNSFDHRFVSVSFSPNARKTYDYFVGYCHWVNIGDVVEVCVHDRRNGGKIVHKKAVVEYISQPDEESYYARSSIVRIINHKMINITPHKTKKPS